MPILGFQLPDALLLDRERFVNARLPIQFSLKLLHPAAHDSLPQFHAAANVTDGQSLILHHAHNSNLKLVSNSLRALHFVIINSSIGE
ncbi:MAG: hypothetical protein ABIR00_06830 [Nitrosospira sp.]